ncbi:LOW QUALITY PROTEIN: mitochondrial uncoupling protein 4 [Trichosurus vulpecula]|uniref:LOW QUALITY PROTEIN: mitochondrial uncoupling protein 4 n=1 Tax=Trichosurus vulpecula TaxID=9337 RepID=UPI00186ADD2E|nr:LOW QUALITY PROTEIN: mitochondrial uncoupling protein 4 [Trichosurus vulpecula]
MTGWKFGNDSPFFFHTTKKFFLFESRFMDTVKHLLLLNISLEDYLTQGLGSICSRLVAFLLGAPADVIKSRAMNQPTDKKEGRGLLYEFSIDCLIQTVQGEGFLSLWLRIIPWSLVFWILTYEKIRYMSGVNPF